MYILNITFRYTVHGYPLEVVKLAQCGCYKNVQFDIFAIFIRCPTSVLMWSFGITTSPLLDRKAPHIAKVP